MDIYTALAEPTRRDIIELLARRGELPASKIYQQFAATPPAISQHLKVLREAKLVDMEKRAQSRVYSVNTKRILELELWARRIKNLWEKKFDKLDKVLSDMEGGDTA